MNDHEKDKRIAALEEWVRETDRFLVAANRFTDGRWQDKYAQALHAAALSLIGEHRPKGRTEHAE